MSIPFRIRAAVLAALVALAPSSAHAQATIKVNDSVSVRVGFLSQTWADFNQNVRQDSSYAQSIFQRRIRLMIGAQIGSHLNFFFETDNPNLGRTSQTATGRNLGAGFITQDAYVEYKPVATSNALLLVAGLQLIPLCRNCLGSAVTLLPIDYGSYSFQQSGVTGSSIGRDVGFQAKGYLYDNRIEYRAGLFSGIRLPAVVVPPAVQTGSNSLRAAGRIQVQLLEPEAPTYSYAGTYLGKRKILAIGGGIDAQSNYKAWAGDAFFSYPFGNNGMTAQANYIHYDGDTFFPALVKQNTFEIEGGYHFTDWKISPFAKFELRDVSDNTLAANQDDHRFQLGLAYYVMGHNLNLKAAYTRGTLGQLAPLGDLTQNGFTFQLQGFYF